MPPDRDSGLRYARIKVDVKTLLLCLSIFLIARASTGRADDAIASPAQRYTFSWPITDSAPPPRGGTTRGAPVTIESMPSAAWHSLQEPRISGVERDRRAILALAGDYRVTFDFLEIVTFSGRARDRPYQSWGTERVYLDQDQSTFVSLVHILEMHIVQADGSVSEPLVTKHWREDWRYEPQQIIEFKGREQWQRRRLSRRESAGQWSQTVAQVDESPRYASLGRWEHNADFSTWISASTWRPLPRRELSVHKDYQVLVGTNRVTLTATGSIQEENNLKMVLAQNGETESSNPFLSREYGVARYERMRDADFAAADQYYQHTRGFWADVHSAWSELYRHNALIVLNSTGAQDLASKLSGYADRLADGRPIEAQAQIIRDSLRAATAPAGSAHRP
jgi:hypothetical protein